jgi:proteasome lid subunit RPN8/RPN11
MIKMKDFDKETKEIKKQIKKKVNTDIDGREVELCGVVVKTPKGIEVRTVENLSKYSGGEYIMDPKGLGEACMDTDFLGGKKKNKFMGVWHTHPFWDSDPSQKDVKNMLISRWYFIYSVINDTLTAFKKEKVI